MEAEVATPEKLWWLKIILENLLPLVVAILTPIIMVLVRKIINKMEEKWNFQMDQDKKQRVEELVAMAIGFAEEKARAALKVGGMTEGQKKLDNAMKFLTGEIKRFGLDAMAAEQLTELIEAKLFKMRADGVIPKDYLEDPAHPAALPPAQAAKAKEAIAANGGASG